MGEEDIALSEISVLPLLIATSVSFHLTTCCILREDCDLHSSPLMAPQDSFVWSQSYLFHFVIELRATSLTATSNNQHVLPSRTNRNCESNIHVSQFRINTILLRCLFNDVSKHRCVSNWRLIFQSWNEKRPIYPIYSLEAKSHVREISILLL